MTTYIHIIDGSNNIQKMAYLVSNFQDGVFLPISISFDSTTFEETKVMYLYAGTSGTRIKMYEDKILGLPGKIRIGGSFNTGYSSYQGRVTCLQFYDTKISSADYDTALTKCMSTLWQHNFGGQSAGKQTGLYHLVSRGEMPKVNAPQVTSFNNSSKVKCASSCMLPSNACVSFTFSNLKRVCNLFEMDYTGSLLSEEMTDYYIIRCCH